MADAVGELEAIIARTALKYDLLPYESKPFPVSQPSRIGGIARLFGLEAAAMDNARVLELGCASGGNIIPHAARYPNATFVGVDLARTQVAAGRARIARMGLTNVEILCKSFTEIGEELGSFDYIICHGVYSWVPHQVQDAIMQVVRARLSPVGIACISYNVLPGWRMMQPIRDALLMAVPESVDSLGRVRMAREMLVFLAEASTDKGPYGDSLRSWAERLATLPDDYLAHEFLEECNEPLLVRDFAGAAARHGLGFLGECELSTMILDNYEAKVADGIRARSGNDMVASEQWLDLLSGRTFRQTLLIAGERMNDVNRALTPESLAGLHFVLPIGSVVKRDGDSATITLPDTRSITSHAPAVADMFEVIGKALPGSTAFDGLVKDASTDGRAAIGDALYRMVLGGLCNVSSEAVPCAAVVSNMPVASLTARSDAEAGYALATNIRHETVGIDAASRVILPMLNGKTDHKSLEVKLLAAAKAGELTYSRDGEAITEAKILRSTIAEHLPNLLSGIANTGLLES